ncbi:hypothetical protein [Actinacidiphila glaucinigra]|uniref:hypothetical protein n=1 Tax=Actinacidiphila glaucinigra TaxID=235986 RepID=UPI0035DA72DD
MARFGASATALSSSAAQGPTRPVPSRIERLQAPRQGGMFLERPVPVPRGEVIMASGRAAGLDVRPVAARNSAPLGDLDPWYFRTTRLHKGYVSTSDRVDLVTARSDNVPAPWWTSNPLASPPYFLAASRTYRSLYVHTDTGKTMMMPYELADFLAADPKVARLASGVPIVLLIEHGGSGGLETPRLVAARTGRPVWSFSGSLRLITDPQSKRSVMGTVVPADESRPLGQWILSSPGDLGAHTPVERATVRPEAGMVKTFNGELLMDESFFSQTLTDSQGRALGRAFLTNPDLAMRERGLTRLGELTTYSQADVDEHRRINPRSGTERPLPWVVDSGHARPYFLVAHGFENSVNLPRHPDREQLTRIDAGQLGAMLNRRPSLRQRPADAPIVLVSCLTGGAHYAPEWQMAQRLADTTGRTVYAPSDVVSVALNIRTGQAGTEGAWRTFHPSTAEPCTPDRKPVDGGTSEASA